MAAAMACVIAVLAVGCGWFAAYGRPPRALGEPPREGSSSTSAAEVEEGRQRLEQSRLAAQDEVPPPAFEDDCVRRYWDT
jgi:hypothetical protein